MVSEVTIGKLEYKLSNNKEQNDWIIGERRLGMNNWTKKQHYTIEINFVIFIKL